MTETLSRHNGDGLLRSLTVAGGRGGGFTTTSPSRRLSAMPLGKTRLRASDRGASDVSLLSRRADVSNRWICLEIQPKMSGLSGCWPQ